MSLSTIRMAPGQSAETFAMEYSGKLLSGLSLSSATVSAVDVSDGSDATSDVVQNTTGTVSGTQVLYTLKTVGVSASSSFRITITAILSNGNDIPDSALLDVVAVPEDCS